VPEGACLEGRARCSLKSKGKYWKKGSPARDD